MEGLNEIGTHQCRRWAASIFAKHVDSSEYLKRGYVGCYERSDYKSANLWLLEAEKQAEFLGAIYARHKTISGYLKSFFERRSRSVGRAVALDELSLIDERLSFAGSECKGSRVVRSSAAMELDALINIAEFHAKQGEAHWLKAYGKDVKGYDFLMGGKYKYFVTAEAQKIWAGYVVMCEYLEWVGVPCPVEFKNGETEQQMLKKIIAGAKRFGCELWWRRALKKKCVRMVEGVLREIGAVKKGEGGKASPYVSKWALGRWGMCNAINKEILSNLEMVNSDGEVGVFQDSCHCLLTI